MDWASFGMEPWQWFVVGLVVLVVGLYGVKRIPMMFLPQEAWYILVIVGVLWMLNGISLGI